MVRRRDPRQPEDDPARWRPAAACASEPPHRERSRRRAPAVAAGMRARDGLPGGCARLVICALLLAAPALARAQVASESEIVAAARRLSVHRLDRRLNDVPLDRWLRELAGPRAVVVWETNDCGEACGCPADSGRDLPVCVEASARLDRGGRVTLRVAMGTASHVPAGAPALHYAEVVRRDGGVATYRALSELGRAIARLRR